MNKNKLDINSNFLIYINRTASFLSQFEQKKLSDSSFKNVHQTFIENNKIQDFNYWNQGTMLMYMYGIFVLPKEFWKKQETSFKFESRKMFSGYEELDNATFLRRLRNSVAHANIELVIGEDGKFVFKNVNKNGNENFSVSISPIGLTNFLNECAEHYIETMPNN